VNGGGRGWVGLLTGLALLFGFVVSLDRLMPHLPGATGEMLRDNQRSNREVGAYFYSEAGDLEDFLDDARGAYGRGALSAGLNSTPTATRGAGR
jgi:hypothetical protein